MTCFMKERKGYLKCVIQMAMNDELQMKIGTENKRQILQINTNYAKLE